MAVHDRAAVQPHLDVSGSAINIDSVDITGDIAQFSGVHQGSLTNSRVHNGILEVTDSAGVTVSGNSFTDESGAPPAANGSLLGFFGGSGDNAVGSTLDGGWSKSNAAGGEVTGIFVAFTGPTTGPFVMESNITVQPNTIQDIRGNGIACAKIPANSLIRGNTITNTGNAPMNGCS